MKDNKTSDVIQVQDVQKISKTNFDFTYFKDFVAWLDRGELTTRDYLSNLRSFSAFLAYKGITAPTRQDILSYRDWLQGEHQAIRLAPDTPDGWEYRTTSKGEPIKTVCKPATVAQYMRSVSQFFRWTAAAGLYPNVAENIHAPKIEKNAHKKEYLQPGDVATIEVKIRSNAAKKELAAATSEKDIAGRMERASEQGKRLFAMYELAVTAGLRTVELSRANVHDLEINGKQAYLWIWGKGHSEPDIRKPIAPQVANAIKDYLNSRSDHYTGASPLFVSTGNRSGGKRIAPSTIGRMLKKAMVQAGYNSTRLTAHSLRHSAAMGALAVTDNNIFEAQKYLRHENPATTEIYLHETAEQEQKQADIAEAVYELFHGNPKDEQADSMEQLQDVLSSLSPKQIRKLSDIAAALAD